jgi:hypothetical protein
MRKDPRVWVIAVLAAVAVAAGAALAAQVPTSKSSARVAARRILGALRLPAGASRAQANPGPPSLGKPPFVAATPNLVDVHEFWRVPGAPRSVLNWITKHPPSGSKAFESGAIGDNGSVVSQFVGFSFLRSSRDRDPSETLLVTVGAARGGGTAVRADAQAVWLLTRPASERVPAGVHAIAVSESRFSGQPPGRWTVTDASRVKRVVAILDRLPAAQPGPAACPADAGPFVTLELATAAKHGRRLATAYVDGGGCRRVGLVIRGHREHPLQGNPRLLGQLSSATGINLR